MREGAPVIHDEADTEGIYDARRNIVHHIEAEGGDAEAPVGAGRSRLRGGVSHIAAAARAHRAARLHHLLGRGRPAGRPLQHAGALPHPAHAGPADRAAGQANPGDQAAHRRRLWQQAGDDPGGPVCPADGQDRPAGAHDVYPRTRSSPARAAATRRSCATRSASRDEQEVVAIDLYLIGDTGAYGTHGLTVQMVAGQKALTLYNAPYSRFVCDVVYTNKPTPGAFRGYGAMQCFFGLETLDVRDCRPAGLGRGRVQAQELDQGRARSCCWPGSWVRAARASSRLIRSNGLDQCVDVGLAGDRLVSQAPNE